MALNPLFNFNGQTSPNKEGDLLHGFVKEVIQINGFNFWYIKRTINKLDRLFGEDVLSSFDQKWLIEMMVEDTGEGWSGEADIISVMGNIFKNQVHMHVAQKRFQEETGMALPFEGDLIYLPNALNKGIFEVKYVDKEKQFYPLGSKPSFRLRCQLFDLSGEKFNTGLDIDDRMNTQGAPQTLEDLDQLTSDSNLTIATETQGLIDATEKSPWGNFGNSS